MIRYWLPEGVPDLKRATPGSSGFDLVSVEDAKIPAGKHAILETGLHLEMPHGIEGQVRGRSGLAANHKLVAVPGTIDSDYRGVVRVTLFNHGTKPYLVKHGDRIAQLVFAPVIPFFRPWHMLNLHESVTITRVPLLEELSPTQRGTGGHGSTGR